MPFGLSDAPSSFQRLMDKTLHGLRFVTIYLDDILVHSENEKVHKDHLVMIFKHLSDAGLSLRSAKCHIGMSTVQYLGHTFSAKGMSPDPKKVNVVMEWPTPTNVTEVRQFLGLASYYRRYIPHFSNVAAPLYNTDKCNFHMEPRLQEQNSEEVGTGALVKCCLRALTASLPHRCQCNWAGSCIGARRTPYCLC